MDKRMKIANIKNMKELMKIANIKNMKELKKILDENMKQIENLPVEQKEQIEKIKEFQEIKKRFYEEFSFFKNRKGEKKGNGEIRQEQSSNCCCMDDCDEDCKRFKIFTTTFTVPGNFWFPWGFIPPWAIDMAVDTSGVKCYTENCLIQIDDEHAPEDPCDQNKKILGCKAMVKAVKLGGCIRYYTEAFLMPSSPNVFPISFPWGPWCGFALPGTYDSVYVDQVIGYTCDCEENPCDNLNVRVPIAFGFATRDPITNDDWIIRIIGAFVFQV